MFKVNNKDNRMSMNFVRDMIFAFEEIFTHWNFFISLVTMTGELLAQCLLNCP